MVDPTRRNRASSSRSSWLGASRLWGALLSWGLAGSCGLLALMPAPALAYTAYRTLFLPRQGSESYAALTRRAEISARAGVQRSFDADPQILQVDLTMMVENQGLTMPLLTVNVSRAQWRERPDIEAWAEYYSGSQLLLGLE